VSASTCSTSPTTCCAARRTQVHRHDPRLHPPHVSAVLPNRLAKVYARVMMWSALQRAARVITVSEASKRDIQRLFTVPSGKIEVIHNGLTSASAPPRPTRKCRASRALPAIGRDHPLRGQHPAHKNLERLIEAFHQLRCDGLEHVCLLIIGDEISKYTSCAAPFSDSSCTSTCDSWVRPRPDAGGALPARHRLRLPSLYEGFGLPPLEPWRAARRSSRPTSRRSRR